MTDAFISLHQIVASWLLDRKKTMHYYVEALHLAAGCVREMALTASLPMVHQTLLTKVAGQNYFQLPAGFTEVVRVGARYGDIWWPLPIADRLMPYPNSTGQGDMDAAEFSPDMNTEGDHISWYGSATTAAGFSGADFAPADFNTLSSGGGSSASAPLSNLGNILNGWYAGGYPYAAGIWNSGWYGVSFDLAHGLIVMPEGFGLQEIYLQYIGVGDMDSMTQIPVKAQAAIEAYIDWKYAANNRNTSRGEAQDWERKYSAQERICRARYKQIGIEVINRIFGQRGLFGRTITC